MSFTPFHQLQTASFRQDIAASQVVRAAIVLAAGVGDAEALARFRQELAGYDPEDCKPEAPAHRMAHAQLMANDRWGRRVPVYFSDAKSLQSLSTVPVIQGLGGLETMLRDAKPGGVFEVEFVPEAHESLIQAIPNAVRVFRVVQASQFAIILEAARQAVFDWATDKINQRTQCPVGLTIAAMLPGIHGAATGETVPPLVASAGISISANNSSVIVQSPSASSSISESHTIDSTAINALVGLLDDLLTSNAGATADEELDRLREKVEELKGLMSIDKPRVSWVKESLGSVRSILENAAGSVLGTAAARPEILAAIQRLLG